MKVAITGASGFLGTAVRAALGSAGHICLDVHLREGAELPTRGVQAIVHLAAIAHRRAPAHELHRVNVELTARVARAADAAGALLVFVSSVKVHGDQAGVPLREHSPIAPVDAYARSKAEAEERLRRMENLRCTILRPPLIYGPGVKANFLALMRAVDAGLPLPFASIRNRRSLVCVGNVADAVVQCVQSSAAAGRTFLLSDGAPLSTPELCREIGHALSRAARLLPFPPALLPAPSLKNSLEVDDSAIRTALGWCPPISFREGLRQTAQWYRGR